MNQVLDASAMIAYLRREDGALVVRDLLRDPAHICYAHTINICEVFYDFVRVEGVRDARRAVRDLVAVGVRPRRDMSTRRWQRAGEIKGTIRRVSIADCFCIALSEALRAVVVTSDHHEFDALVATNFCRVLFIR